MTGIYAPGTSCAHLPVYCEIRGIGTHGDGDTHWHISLAKVAIGNIDIVLHGDWERPNDFGSRLYDYVSVYGYEPLPTADQRHAC